MFSLSCKISIFNTLLNIGNITLCNPPTIKHPIKTGTTALCIGIFSISVVRIQMRNICKMVLISELNSSISKVPTNIDCIKEMHNTNTILIFLFFDIDSPSKTMRKVSGKVISNGIYK